MRIALIVSGIFIMMFTVVFAYIFTLLFGKIHAMALPLGVVLASFILVPIFTGILCIKSLVASIRNSELIPSSVERIHTFALITGVECVLIAILALFGNDGIPSLYLLASIPYFVHGAVAKKFFANSSLT